MKLKQERDIVAVVSLKEASSGVRWLVGAREKVESQFNSVKQVLTLHRLASKSEKAQRLLTELNKINFSVTKKVEKGSATASTPGQLTIVVKEQEANSVPGVPEIPTGPPIQKPIQFKKKRQESRGKKILWDQIKAHPKAEKKGRVLQKEILWFTKQLSILLSSGVPLTKSIATMQEHSVNRQFKHILDVILHDLQEGYPLSVALSRFPRQFSNLYVALVSVGESSGALPKCLLEISRFLDIQQKVTRGLKTAIIYPSIVLGVLLAMMVAGSYFFIPTFKDLLLSLDMELPALTRIVFFVAENILCCLGGLFGLAMLLHLPLRKIEGLGRQYIVMRDKLLLRVPIIKDLIVTSAMFYFTYTVSLMLHNGVRMVDSLIMAQNTVSNKVVQSEIYDTIELVGEGASLSEALAEQPHFNPIIRSMVHTGEESGRTDFILEQLGHYYAELLDVQIKNTIQFVQPAALLVMASVVVPVLFAVLVPLLDVTSGQFM